MKMEIDTRMKFYFKDKIKSKIRTHSSTCYLVFMSELIWLAIYI